LEKILTPFHFHSKSFYLLKSPETGPVIPSFQAFMVFLGIGIGIAV
jgi:hypothetical protein